jgi:hypothetical protein
MHPDDRESRLGDSPFFAVFSKQVWDEKPE